MPTSAQAASVPVNRADARRFKVRDRDGQIVGTGAELRRVSVQAIKMDSAYQRDVDMRWVNKHLPFDPAKAQAVILSDRLGGPWCLDGQHRVVLARESGVETIAALVISGLGKQQEAELFVGYQQDRRALRAWDLFRAEQVAGREEALSIVRVVNSSGFTVSDKPGDTHILAIDALRKVYRIGGDALLGRVLLLIRRTWLGEARSTSGQIIHGLGLFLYSADADPRYDSTRLADIVGVNSPSRIIREAQAVSERRSVAGGSTATNVAEALFDLYNRNIKPDRRLARLTMPSGRARPKPYVTHEPNQTGGPGR